MRAAESLPLVMEPSTRFYVSPVLVLDFQSLYPSIMSAYNYCFSTCLGRVEPVDQDQFGATSYDIPEGYLDLLKDHITGMFQVHFL